MSDRKYCSLRHENGNCLAVGGFCLAVPDKLCEDAQEMKRREIREIEAHKPLLEPCPLCGKEVRWNSGYIECRCGLSFRPGYSFEETNRLWNNRYVKKTRQKE